MLKSNESNRDSPCQTFQNSIREIYDVNCPFTEIKKTKNLKTPRFS